MACIDPPSRRHDFVDRYFRRAQPDQVVANIKSTRPSIMTAIGKDHSWHLEMKVQPDPSPDQGIEAMQGPA